MADPILTVTGILTANWNSSNTDGKTPTIDSVHNYKRVDVASGDFILVYPIDYVPEVAGLGGGTENTMDDLSIDIRTSYSGTTKTTDVRSHLIKLLGEVKRIVKLKVAAPDSNYQVLKPLRGKDLSDKMKQLGRYVYDVRLQNWGV